MKTINIYSFFIFCLFSNSIFGSNSTLITTSTPSFEIQRLANFPNTTNETVAGFTISDKNLWNIMYWGVDQSRCVVTNSQGGIQGATLEDDYLYVVFKNIKINKTPHAITCLASLLGQTYTDGETINGFTLVMPTPTFTSGSSQNVPCYITTAQISLNDYKNVGGHSDGLEITDEFEWTLPSGWQTTSSQTGTFVAGKSISIILPTSTTSQSITVRAKAYDQYSSTASLQITRNIGQFTINGNTIVDCKRRYSYSTQYYPGVSYSWQLPQGWTGSSSSSVISTYAGYAGTISMTATACGQTYTAQLTVTKSKIVPDNSYITGSDILCLTGSTYGLSSIFNNNSTFSWSVSNNILTPPSTDRYVTLNATGNGTGTVTVNAVNNSCGSQYVDTKNIWVGGPDLSNITVYYTEDITGYYSNEFCPGQTNELLARANPSIDMKLNSINWDMGSWDVYNYNDEGYVLFGIPLSFSDYENVYYEVSNNCNTGIGSVTLYEGVCSGYYMILSPNPSSGETTLTIGTTNMNEQIDDNEEWDLDIYDQQQNLKTKFQKVKGNKKEFEVSTWKEGNYFLKVKYKDKYIVGRLIVTKN